MEKENRRYNWLISAGINLVILIAVILCTHMVYETNDDYAIASRIADGYPEVNFVNYYLCRVLIRLQGLMPGINAYVAAQMFCSYVSFTCILKMIMDATDRRWVRIVAVLTIAAFSIDHYCTIQFTKTAALLIVAGLMILADSITRKRHAGYYIIGIMLLYIGVAFRIDGLIAAIGFTGLYLLKWLLENRRTVVKDGYFKPARLVLYVVLIALIGGCYGFEHMSYKANIASDELKTYKEYSILRSAVVDYPLYEYYEEYRYISHYFVCEAAGVGRMRLTDAEARRGVTPQWLPLQQAIDIFSRHQSYSRQICIQWDSSYRTAAVPCLKR